jgi:hypothetical protein
MKADVKSINARQRNSKEGISGNKDILSSLKMYFTAR